MRYDTKFQPKWKGPYQVVATLDKRAYWLFLDRKEFKSTINSNLLKLCHNKIGYKLIIIVEYKNL